MKTRTMPEIDLTLEPSWLLSGVLLTFALAGLVVIAIYIADWNIQLALAALLLVTTVYHVLRDGLRRWPTAWKHLHVSTQGELRLTNQAGRVFTPRLAGSTWVHPWLTVLHFERPTRPVFWRLGLPPVILLGTADTDACRQLRVWLHWWRHSDDPQADSSDLAT